MKKPMILGLAVAVMTVTSLTVSADSQYPASDFEPQVIYLDKSVAAKTAEPASNSQATPACAPGTTAQASTQAAAEEIDPKYPAASFQPKVIYP
jgi:hypothetical protein